MIQIVHIIGGLDVGGAELMLERLCLAHREMDLAESTVISLTELGEIGGRLEAQGIKVHALHLSGSIQLPSVVWWLRTYLVKLQPDIVQTWLYHADLIGAVAAKLARQKVIVWNIRCSTPMGNIRTKILAKTNAILSNWLPNSIICCGEVAKNYHVAIGYRSKICKVLPNGFDSSHFIQRGNLSLRTNLQVTAIGRNNPAKDYPTLIRAASIVVKKLGDVRFSIHGRGIPEDKSLRDLAFSLGGAELINFEGPKKDVRPILASTDIFCSSSTHEGFPNVIGEAMLMEIPCVATAAGDSAEIIGETGRVVPVSEPDALASGIIEVARMSQQDRLRLGKLARTRIISKYELRYVAMLYQDHYRKLLGMAA